MIRLGVALMVVGAVVVALPDDGKRLFSLSDTHGPSRLDAVGIVLLLAGWFLLLSVIWRGRARLARPRPLVVGGAVLAAGAAILVLGIAAEGEWWWLVGAAVMAGIQVVALRVAARDGGTSASR